MKLIKQVIELFEEPYVHDDELSLNVLGTISAAQLARAWSKIGTAKVSGDLSADVYERNQGSGFISGFLVGDKFKIAVDLNVRRNAYPVEPTQLGDYRQVSMVRTTWDMADIGIARATYREVARAYDLVSDQEQFIGGKAIWVSLARAADVNVYVFKQGDYIRGTNGKPLKFNGSNIQASEIWGKGPEHRAALLVATKKELN